MSSKVPKHEFIRCVCQADPKPHCIAMMPDNTFCCRGEKSPCHKVEVNHEQ
jgi:hypothetical protein